MTGVRTRVLAAVFVGLLVGSVLAPLAGAPAAAQQAAGDPIVVRQGEQCAPLEPLGNGTRTVEEFYDYRSPYTEPENSSERWYSAYGDRIQELMLADTSQVFLYRGSEGLSLVFLHDGVSNTSDSGGTVAANVTGLPLGGEWVVQDDDYPGQDDDIFEANGSTARAVWAWNNGNRSDGGAITGLANGTWEEIRIEPAFNQQSPRYPFERWDGAPADNRIERWIARSANGSTYELDMAEPVTIARGPCDDEAPTADLSATPEAPTAGQAIRFDAGGSRDNDAIAAYRWDFDGDGTVETTTTDATVTRSYNRTGTYSPRVTVVDRANNTANATLSLQVSERTTTAMTTTTATETESPTSDGSADSSPTTERPANDETPWSGVLDRLDRLAEETVGMDEGSLLGLAVLALALLVIAVVIVRW